MIVYSWVIFVDHDLYRYGLAEITAVAHLNPPIPFVSTRLTDTSGQDDESSKTIQSITKTSSCIEEVVGQFELIDLLVLTMITCVFFVYMGCVNTPCSFLCKVKDSSLIFHVNTWMLPKTNMAMAACKPLFSRGYNLQIDGFSGEKYQE